MSNSAVKHKSSGNNYADAEDVKNSTSTGGDRISAQGH